MGEVCTITEKTPVITSDSRRDTLTQSNTTTTTHAAERHMETEITMILKIKKTTVNSGKVSTVVDAGIVRLSQRSALELQL